MQTLCWKERLLCYSQQNITEGLPGSNSRFLILSWTLVKVRRAYPLFDVLWDFSNQASEFDFLLRQQFVAKFLFVVLDCCTSFCFKRDNVDFHVDLAKRFKNRLQDFLFELWRKRLQNRKCKFEIQQVRIERHVPVRNFCNQVVQDELLAEWIQLHGFCEELGYFLKLVLEPLFCLQDGFIGFEPRKPVQGFLQRHAIAVD